MQRLLLLYLWSKHTHTQTQTYLEHEVNNVNQLGSDSYQTRRDEEALEAIAASTTYLERIAICLADFIVNLSSVA